MSTSLHHVTKDVCFTIWPFFFQAIDYKAWKPVRHIDLGLGEATGLCVSNHWLVVTTGFWEITVHVYSLPDAKQHHSQNFSVPIRRHEYGSSEPQFALRADSTGLIYVPCSTYVAVLEISETGNLTLVRNITAGGELWEVGHISLAVGPETGQLYVASYNRPNFTVVHVNTANNSIARTLTLPHTVYSEIPEPAIGVAMLNTGQILVLCLYWENGTTHKVLYIYRSVSEPPELLASLTWWGNCLGHRNQFLILDRTFASVNIRVLSDNGTLLHTVDVLSGRDGVWLLNVADVAIWEDCGWMLGHDEGALVLLCPI